MSIVAEASATPAVERATEASDTPPLRRPRTKQELLATISASRLGTWLSCRLRFYFRYVAGITKAPSPAMHIGTVVHAVLQQWNLARWRNAPLDGDMINTVFHDAWTAKQAGLSIRWEEAEHEFKASAWSLLDLYLRETPIPLNERPEAVEVTAEMDMSHHGLPALVGILDLVRSGGCIVDFKTVGRTPDPEKVKHVTEIQTTIYALLYREATDWLESGIELHHLVRLKTPKLMVTQVGPARDSQIERLYRQLDSYVRGLESEDFVPSPGLQCSSCEFFNACRHWH